MFSSIVDRLDERRDGAKEAGVDAGFTLIELMVVLLIMAILLAIAIPTFLGVSNSANDRAAQSNLNTALTNVKSYYQNNQQSFPTAAATLTGAMSTQEPSVSWTTGDSSSSGQISVYTDTVTGSAVILAAYSKPTNTCWYLVDNETPSEASTTDAVFKALPAAQLAAGTWYGGGKVASGGACTADNATFPSGVNWNSAGQAGFQPVS